jgi:hypothetical protein
MDSIMYTKAVNFKDFVTTSEKNITKASQL